MLAGVLCTCGLLYVCASVSGLCVWCGVVCCVSVCRAWLCVWWFYCRCVRLMVGVCVGRLQMRATCLGFGVCVCQVPSVHCCVGGAFNCVRGWLCVCCCVSVLVGLVGFVLVWWAVHCA